MKKLLIFLTFVTITSCPHGQELLSKIKPPVSPAASALGLQPSGILVPKSLNELEVSIYPNLYDAENQSLIPRDFALEFTPYWFQDHGLQLQEYLYPKNVLDEIARTSSFSIASTPNYLMGDSSKTKSVALGYRTSIHFSNSGDRNVIGELNSALERKLETLSEIKAIAFKVTETDTPKTQTAFLEKMTSRITAAYEDDEAKIQEMIRIVSNALDSIPQFSAKFLNAFNDQLDKRLELKKTAQDYSEYIKNRQGLYLDFAMASAMNFPDNNFKTVYLPRASFWITPSYKFNSGKSFFRFSGVVRFEWYNREFYNRYFPNSNEFARVLDYGLALAGEFGKWSAQLELVGRTKYPEGSGDNDMQYIGSINYRVNDEIILSYNFGSRFKPEVNPDNTLVSILTLNIGFGTFSLDDLSM